MAKSDLDRHFPRNGGCFLHPSRYARHRLVAAIRGRRAAGESAEKLSDDFDLPRAAILAAIRSTPDDNRMTPKEQRESERMWGLPEHDCATPSEDK